MSDVYGLNEQRSGDGSRRRSSEESACMVRHRLGTPEGQMGPKPEKAFPKNLRR